MKNMNSVYLIILTILGYGLGSFFYKLANDRINPVLVLLIAAAVGAMVAPGLLTLKFDHTWNFYGILFSILGCLTMGVGSLCYFYALKNGNAGEVTILTASYPLLTLILSVIFLNEGMDLKKIIGIGLAAASFIVISY